MEIKAKGIPSDRISLPKATMDVYWLMRLIYKMSNQAGIQNIKQLERLAHHQELCKEYSRILKEL